MYTIFKPIIIIIIIILCEQEGSTAVITAVTSVSKLSRLLIDKVENLDIQDEVS